MSADDFHGCWKYVDLILFWFDVYCGQRDLPVLPVLCDLCGQIAQRGHCDQPLHFARTALHANGVLL